MPTSKAGTLNNHSYGGTGGLACACRHSRQAQEGFTLTEVIVVVFIISLFAAFTIPRLADVGELKLNRTAAHIGRTITYLYSEAVAHHQVVRLTFDLASGKYYPASLSAKGEFEPTRFPLFASGKISEGITVKRFVTMFGGSFSGTQAYVHLLPEGFAEKALIILDDGHGRTVSLLVDPLTGRVKTERGEAHIEFAEQGA
ncbi:MAG: type II secretion system protein [Nitrospinae bacterium]|nr:type II secretion system protein [Nitrospinota bacterium]